MKENEKWKKEEAQKRERYKKETKKLLEEIKWVKKNSIKLKDIKENNLDCTKQELAEASSARIEERKSMTQEQSTPMREREGGRERENERERNGTEKGKK